MLEKSLPFDKYKDKEYMERKQRLQFASQFNLNKAQMNMQLRDFEKR